MLRARCAEARLLRMELGAGSSFSSQAHCAVLYIDHANYFSVPAGLVALVTIFVFMPTNFPYHGQEQKKTSNLTSVDGIGATLMLAAIIFLITGFEEASNGSSWKSAQVLALILMALPCIVALLWYERRVTLKGDDKPQPVFPWRFCTNRVIIGLFV